MKHLQIVIRNLDQQIVDTKGRHDHYSLDTTSGITVADDILDLSYAKVLAAAPDLLEALEALWSALSISEVQRIENEVGPIYSQVKDAINKAKGV